MGEKMYTKTDIPFVLEFLNHEIYDIRKSAEVIMHTIDPEDTYTIHIVVKEKKIMKV
jgi:hypothetical protein